MCFITGHVKSLLVYVYDISEASDKGKIYNPAGMKRLEELTNAKLAASASPDPETKKPVGTCF